MDGGGEVLPAESALHRGHRGEGRQVVGCRRRRAERPGGRARVDAIDVAVVDVFRVEHVRARRESQLILALGRGRTVFPATPLTYISPFFILWTLDTPQQGPLKKRVVGRRSNSLSVVLHYAATRAFSLALSPPLSGMN